jgi:hypothetical protein
MTMLESAYKVLNRGLLIRLFYKNKNNVIIFTDLMRGDFYNKIYPEKNLKHDIIYDVLLEKEFDFSVAKSIEVIEFPFILPFKTEGRVFDDDHILFDENYKNECKTFIDDFLFFINNEYKKILNVKSDEFYEDKDVYTLRFYPKKFPKNKTNVKDTIKKDICEKFFVASFQDENYNLNQSEDGLSLISAFSKFGILQKNENCTDPVFLNALKRKWAELIEDAKKELIDKCNDIDLKKLSEREREEFKKEFNLLKKELKDINIKILESFKTPKEVVSYWPELLQPTPDYVFTD